MVAMKINLLTDAPKHNLALMKISAYHKAKGDEVVLNAPITQQADLTYGSWLYSHDYYCDIYGGPATDPKIRLNGFEDMKPDYDLYNLDYSLGATWEYCPRKCGFCVVPKQNNPKEHRSIWTFHDSKFKKICLLNNNTFSDPQWLETFQEIWDAELTVLEHGFDLRLLDAEKLKALKRTKFEGAIHFAWDQMKTEGKIREGLQLIKGLNVEIYVLVGYNTTREEDLHRCQVIHDNGFDPYVMPYKTSGKRSKKSDRDFKRFIDLRYYRKYKTIKQAWEDYN